MSWLDNYVRPRIQQLVRRSPSPTDLWRQCGECAQMIFHRDLEQALMVCPNCHNHMRIGAQKRFDLLLDDGSREDLVMPETAVDPLKFRDRKRYTDRLKEAHSKNGPGDALKAASGTINGAPAVVVVLDFAFMGGSMGAAVGAGFVVAVRAAVEKGAGFIAITASGGARMQEGILSLMQMPRTVAAIGMLRDAGLPYITVLTDPTTGGVSASFAMLGDVAIAEPAAAIGFAGQRVIKETIGQTLPDGFQRAEYLHDHGMLDIVTSRDTMKETIGRVLSLLQVSVVEAEETPLDPVESVADDTAQNAGASSDASIEASSDAASEAATNAGDAAPEMDATDEALSEAPTAEIEGEIDVKSAPANEAEVTDTPEAEPEQANKKADDETR